MKKIFVRTFCWIFVIFFLLEIAVPTTAFAERKFCRIEGRALRYALPSYQGTPPAQYAYKSLGYITYTYKYNFFESGGYAMCAALEGLVNKAKEMGANAVIKVEPNPKGVAKGLDFAYAGEAVIFDKLPEKPYR